MANSSAEAEKESANEPAQKLYGCRYCMKTFDGTLEELKDHRRAHEETLHPYECPVCSKVFKQQAHRDSHIRTHTGDCWMVFKQSSHLKRHRWRRHSKDSLRPYPCQHCSKRYSQKWDLDAHYRAYHCVKGPESHPYKCPKCGRGFTQLSNLRTHQRRVVCTADYQCPHCYLKFKSEVYHRTHVASCESRTQDVTNGGEGGDI